MLEKEKMKIITNKPSKIPKLRWVRLIRVKEPFIIARLFYEQWRDNIRKEMDVNFRFLRHRTQIDGHFCIESDFLDFVEAIKKVYRKNEYFLEKLFRAYIRTAKNYIKLTQKIKKLPLKSYSNRKLIDYFLKYVIEAYKRVGVFIYLPVAAKIILVKEIYNWFLGKNFSEEEIDYFFEVIGRVNKERYSYYETKDLLKIFEVWKRKKNKIDKEINQLINKFLKNGDGKSILEILKANH